MNSKQNAPLKRAKIIIADNNETADFQAEGYATKEMLLHMFDAAVRGWMELYHQYSPEMSKWQVCNLFTDIFTESVKMYRNGKE